MSPRLCATAACFAVLAFTAADAAVVVTTYSHLTDLPHYPVYVEGNGVPSGTGVHSRASAIDRERSRLLVGGVPVFQDLSTGLDQHASTTAGQTVQAHASLGPPAPPPVLGPAVSRAMSGLFENHVSASTAHQLTFWNSNPGTVDGSTYAPEFFYKQHRREAAASSTWYDTWTAAASSQVDIELALDGRLLGAPFCPPGQVCGVGLPAGTDAFRSDSPYVRLDARFIVFDLDQLAFCPPELLDDCGPSDVGHPMPMSILTARYEGDEDLPIDFLGQFTLSFLPIAGHRYVAMGQISVEAQNGGVIDFFNTMRITDIKVGAGVLHSQGTGGDLADYFRQGPGVVPAPATAWLLLLGCGAAAFHRRRPAAPGSRDPSARHCDVGQHGLQIDARHTEPAGRRA